MSAKNKVTPQKSKRGGAGRGQGRKPSHVEADLQALMDSAWPQADRIEVVKALHQKAIAGSVQAAIVLLDRALGKPVERQIVDREANDKLEIEVKYEDPEPRED